MFFRVLMPVDLTLLGRKHNSIIFHFATPVAVVLIMKKVSEVHVANNCTFVMV